MSENNLMVAVNDKLSALSDRERFLLVFTAIVVVGVIIWFVVHSVNASLEVKEKAIRDYRTALTYISENQATYEINRKQKEEVRQKLLSADSKIASKLTSMASSLGFDVTVTPKDAHKIQDDSGAEEQEIEVTFKGVEYRKFVEYIVQIQQQGLPIYMRHLNVNRTSNNSTADTKVTVSITLMSYRLKEPNAT